MMETYEEFAPEEEDGYIFPCGQLGSRTSASYAGKHLGEYSSDDEALEAIREKGNLDGYFPNVWHVSDHGNHMLIEDFNWEL